MKFDVFFEFARIVKKGGFVIVSCRESYYLAVKEKADGIFKKLQDDGTLKRWSFVNYPNHIGSMDGICFIFQKL
jgi:hypothetical protein